MTIPHAVAAAVALLATAALAGCSGGAAPHASPPPQADMQAAEPHSSTPAPAAASPPAGRLDANVTGEVRRNFDLTGCLDPRMLFVLDPGAAQALLPPGFKAADATALVQFTGAPFGSPVPAGQAVGGYDFLSCGGNTLDNASVAFSEVGILVQPPDLGARTPLQPATYDLYLLAFHTTSPAWQALALASGYTPSQAPLAKIASAAPDAGLDNHLGSGLVSTAGPLGAAEYAVPAAGRDLDLEARYWHVGANGTGYLDFHLSENVRAGPITSCTHAAGSVFAEVAGTVSCTTEKRFAAVGLGTRVAGTSYWLPGVFPKA